MREHFMSTILTADHCIKCNICTSACPVAAVTDQFPGPKVVGPQLQRFRQSGFTSADRSLDYCSGCGVCSQVCPHEVQIAEMNAIARAGIVERDGLSRRNWIISQPEKLGRLGSAFAPVSNIPLRLRPARWLIEKTIKIDRRAPLPKFSRRTFRGWFRRNARHMNIIGSRKVLYFHSCSTNYYEPHVGKAAVKVLERNGCKVVLGEQNCCGLPLQSNGAFEAAREYARENIRKLAPYVRENYVIVGTSTSCTLALKHEYRAVLGLEGPDVELVAENTFDLFEFLSLLADGNEFDLRLKSRNMRVFYHGPCQLRSHYVGQPAIDLLRRIPMLDVTESTAACCGVAGTYGLKIEKYGIARDVGASLFAQIEAAKPDRIVSDSESCRWWIEQHTGIKTVHPVELLAQAYPQRVRNR